MKACVVEIRENFAAVLTDEGCIIKVKDKNYAIGQVIELKKQAIHFSVKTAAIAASVAIVMLLGSVTAWAYYTPSTYVSLDVNPSIEYSVNRFDRVLSAQAVNSDGAEILSDLSLNNMTIDEAIRDTVDQIQSEGYFKDSGGIVISTSGDDEQAAQGLAEDLKDVAAEAVKDSGAPVEVEAISVGRARVLEAQKLGTTPGRLNLVQKLQASAGTESIDLQEWLKKPVKDIMKAIKTAKKQSKDSSGSDTVSAQPVESSDSSAAAASSSEAESQAASSQTQSSLAKQAGKSGATPAKKASSKSSGASSKENSSSSEDKNTPKNGKGSLEDSSGESSATSPDESTTSVDSSSDSAVKDNNGKPDGNGSNGNGGSGTSNNGSGKSNSGKGSGKK